MRLFHHARLHLGLLLASLLTLALPAAAQGLYYDRDSFLAAIASAGAVHTEGFESYAVDLAPGSRTLALKDYTVSYRQLGGDSNFGISNAVDTVNRLVPTDGSQYMLAHFLSTAMGTYSAVTFQFDPPIVAFGIDLIGVDGLPQLGINAPGVLEFGAFALVIPNHTVQFLGITNFGPMRSITIGEPSFGDDIAFDRSVYVLASVPEPGSWALIVAGIAVVAGIALRRDRKAVGRPGAVSGPVRLGHSTA